MIRHVADGVHGTDRHRDDAVGGEERTPRAQAPLSTNPTGDDAHDGQRARAGAGGVELTRRGGGADAGEPGGVGLIAATVVVGGLGRAELWVVDR